MNLKEFQTQMQRVSSSMKRTGDQMKQMGTTMSTYLTAPMLALSGVSLHLWDTQEQALAQVRTGLESTGGAAGKTLEQLTELASQMQDKSLYGDENILKNVTAQLLTFTNIAGDQFDRTQQAALDLATRLGGDLKSAAIQLGKALNDPVANLSALSRSGIQFTDSQKAMINSLWEAGDAAAAQGLILAELEKQYGGSAQAAAEAGLGGFKQLQNLIGDLTEEIGGIIAKAILPLVSRLKEAVKSLQALSPEVKEKIVLFGGLAAAIGPALIAIGSLTKIMGSLALAGATVSAPILAIGAAVAGAAALIIKNWQPINAYFTSGEGAQLWNGIKQAAESAWQGIQVAIQAFVGLVKVIWDKFGTDILALASVQFQSLVNTVTSALQIIGDLFSTLSYLLQGDWANMWKSLGNAFITFYNWIVGMAGSLAKAILYPIQKIAEGAGWTGLSEKLAEVSQGIEFFTEFIKANRFEVDGAEKSTINLSDAIGGLQDQISGLSDEPIKRVTTSLDQAARLIEPVVRLRVKAPNLTPGISQDQGIRQEVVPDVIPTGIDQFKEETAFLESRLQNVGNSLSNLFDDAIAGVVDGAGDMTDAFHNFFTSLQKDIAQAIAKFLVLRTLSAAFGIASGGTGFLGGILGVPAFASGGIVTGPTLAMVGEGGESEAILPLSKLRALIGSNEGGNVRVSGEFMLSGEVAKATIERSDYRNSR